MPQNRSYLSNYDSSAFNAGVAAQSAIEEHQNQVLLEHEREQANIESEQRRAAITLKNEMALYSFKAQEEAKIALAAARNPALLRQHQLDNWETAHTTAEKAVLTENNKRLGESKDDYDPSYLKGLQQQNDSIYKAQQDRETKRPDPYAGPVTPDYLGAAPQITPPVFSKSYLDKQKADAAEAAAKSKKEEAEAGLIPLRAQSLREGNALKEAKLKAAQQSGGMTDAEFRAYGKTVDAAVGSFNQWRQKWAEAGGVTDRSPDAVKFATKFSAAAPAMTRSVPRFFKTPVTNKYWDHLLNEHKGGLDVSSFDDLMTHVQADANGQTDDGKTPLGRAAANEVLDALGRAQGAAALPQPSDSGDSGEDDTQ